MEPGLAAVPNAVLLPPLTFTLSPGPPTAGVGAVVGEQRIPLGTTTAERVLVTIDPRGRPVAIAVVQRLTLNRAGDYTFVVAAPVTSVTAAAGSESQPGLRHNAIVWNGFSPGRKVLAVRATLRPGAAAKVLPVRIRARGGTLTVVNSTVAQAPVLVGAVVPASGAAALDRTRRAVLDGEPAPNVRVIVPGPVGTSRVVRITAALQVAGTAGGKPFSRRIGGGSPERFTIRVPEGPIRLTVTPVAPLQMLRPPGNAPTWVEALRRGDVDTRGLLEYVSRVRLTLARAHQYELFVESPNSAGRTSVEYVYATGEAPAAPTTTTATPLDAADTSGAPWGAIATALVLLLGGAGLAALWARS